MCTHALNTLASARPATNTPTHILVHTKHAFIKHNNHHIRIHTRGRVARRTARPKAEGGDEFDRASVARRRRWVSCVSRACTTHRNLSKKHIASRQPAPTHTHTAECHAFNIFRARAPRCLLFDPPCARRAVACHVIRARVVE